jgi:hypothetical protein
VPISELETVIFAIRRPLLDEGKSPHWLPWRHFRPALGGALPRIDATDLGLVLLYCGCDVTTQTRESTAHRPID